MQILRPSFSFVKASRLYIRRPHGRCQRLGAGDIALHQRVALADTGRGGAIGTPVNPWLKVVEQDHLVPDPSKCVGRVRADESSLGR
jgi:hypothetical protein